MSVQTHSARGADPRGAGWIVFGGAMLLLLGSINAIHGIAAISNSKFFVGDAKFVFGDLKTWGWIILLLGIGQLLAAFGIFANNRAASWLGVCFAGLNAMAQLLWISTYPFLALALFSLDVLVIYGLVVYGGRETA
jgi:hypothetical protein